MRNRRYLLWLVAAIALGLLTTSCTRTVVVRVPVPVKDPSARPTPTPTPSRRRGGADSRILEALDRMGIKYRITRLGNFRIVFRLSGGRTQLGFINSRTQRLGGLEIREIWSVGYVTYGLFSRRVANVLMRDSFRKKMGGWQMVKRSRGKYAGVFSIKTRGDLSDKELRSSLMLVLKAADRMELKLTGKDDY